MKFKLILAGMTIAASAAAQSPQCCRDNCCEPAGYLFAYFTGNDMADESIHFAVSDDGFNYRALNGNRPVIDSREISSTGGVRDPHILRGHDGKTF